MDAYARIDPPSQGKGRSGHFRIRLSDHILCHGRKLRDKTESGGYVEEEHAPEHPPLGGLHGFVKGERIGGRNTACGLRRKSGREPSLGRILKHLGRSEAQNQEDDAPDVERLRHTHGNHHGGSNLAHEEGARAETHNRKTRHETALVGKPADQGGDGGNIPETVPQTGNETKTKPHQPDVAYRIGKTGNKCSDTEQNTADGGHKLGAFFIHQGSAEGGGDADHADADHERHLNGCLSPAVGGHQGFLEDGPRIDRPQTQLHDDCRNGNQPSLTF